MISFPGEPGDGRRWRIAVAGCGGAAFGIHLPVLAAHPALEILAVTDRERGRAEQATARFGGRVTDSVADLLDGADLLAVLTGVHEPWIETALAAGIHVFTEKPVSLDVDRTRRLRSRAAAAGLLLEVGAIRAFDGAVTELLRRLPRPELLGGCLVKADGCDEKARRPFLPSDASSYTFDRDPQQPGPAALDPAGRRALEILLWQGYHSLITLVLAAPGSRPVSCALSANGEVVRGTARTRSGALICCTVGSAAPGVHVDHAVLTGADTTFVAEFPPPYGPVGSGSLFACGASKGPVVVQAEAPARRMWSSVADRLTARSQNRQISPGTAHIAENVERLAYELASLSTVDDDSNAAKPASPHLEPS